MIIFIIVGIPAAGKNIACEHAASNEYPYFFTGDIVRAEVKRRGINPDAENKARNSTEMRGNDGLGVTRIVISEAIKKNAPAIFILFDLFRHF